MANEGLPQADVIPLRGLRRTAAERLGRHTAPQVSLGLEVDFEACLAARARHREAWRQRHGVDVSINDLVLAATARALKQHPDLNAAFIEGAIHRYREINLGLAVDVADGLIVAVLRNADRLDVGKIAVAARFLSERARTRRILPTELEGGTFTVTNLGASGIDWFTPILNPPQCAVLGVAQLRRVAVVEGERIVPGYRLGLVLSFDHRVLDGVPAARFLATLRQILEPPDPWLT